MHKFTKLFIYTIVLVLLVAGLNAKVPRRILMEDHTGAWCGWCVMGNQAMEDMLVKYGDKFIPVAVHQGDKMSVGNVVTIQSTVSKGIPGFSGYPSGLLNRKFVIAGGNNTRWHHPIYWPTTVQANIEEQSDVDVTLDWNLDKEGKKLTATLKAKMEANYDGQLAFNLYIMEDGQTGTGTGWDQQNYLSGNSSYKDHPYYSKPAVITNYKHMNVLIDAIGGSWGDINGFPNPAVAGQTYEKSYEVDLSKYPIQNYDNLWFVGLVQETGSKYEILNCVSVNKKMPKPSAYLTATNEQIYLHGTLNNNTKQSVTFKNSTKYNVQADFYIDLKESRMPEGWTAELSSNTEDVNAGAEAKVDVTINVGSNAGYAQVVVKSKVKGTDEYDGDIASLKVGLLSDGVDQVFYEVDEIGMVPLYESLIAHETYKTNSAVIPYNSTAMTEYPSSNFKLAVFPESFDTRGSLVLGSNADFLRVSNEYIDAGKPLLITSIDDLWFIGGNYSSSPNAATMTLFKDKLRISGYTMASPYRVTTTSTSSVPVIIKAKGEAGDDISDGMEFSVNAYDAVNHPYYTYWVDQVKPLDWRYVQPFLRWNEINMSQEQNLAAVKIHTGKGKAAYMGFCFDLIQNKLVRTTLLGNVITWLLSPVSVDEDLDNLNSANISAYPNPAINNFTVKFESKTPSDNSIFYLTDVNGDKVKDISRGSIGAGNQELNVSVSDLSSGKYYVVANINGIMSIYPIVITK